MVGKEGSELPCENCKREGSARLQKGDWDEETMVSVQIAAADGHPLCLKALIKAGAYVNYIAEDCDSKTSLMYAASYGHPECVDILIKAGADVNKTTSDKSNALHSVCSCDSYGAGHFECARLLVDAGVDLFQEVDADGWYESALMSATQNGYPAIVKLLIEAGVEVNRSYDSACPAIACCTTESDDSKECIDILMKAGADVNCIVHDKTPLMWAAYSECGSDTTAEALVKLGADVNTTNSCGETAMHLMRNKGVAFCKNLVDAGGDVNAKSSTGQTPLMTCARNYRHGYFQARVVEALIKVGADVNMTDNRGETVLHGWTLMPQTYKKLIAAGADVNARSNTGETPLMTCEGADVVETLLNSGADVNITDDTGSTAFHTLRQVPQTFKMLMDAGANVNARSNTDETPLMCATRYGNARQIEAVETLLKLGADVNIIDDRGETVLHRICHNEPSVYKMLMSAGGDINARSNTGETPLMRAADNRARCTQIETLIQAGAY